MMEKSDQELPFKIFVPRAMSMSPDSLASSASKVTKDDDFSSFSLGLSQPTPPLSARSGDKAGTFSFDFSSLRGSSSPSSLFNSDPLMSYSGDPNLPKRLHVSNIPFRYREHNLVMLFGKFGNVEDAEIIYNDKGSKGFGFVTMSRGQDADDALIRLNHAIVEGRIIEVNLATPKVNTARGATPAPVSLASSQALVEAETKLARAKVEVLKLRKQMQMFNYFKSGAEPRDI